MNRLRLRTSAAKVGVAACGLVTAFALAGCGAGQISQVATQEPAVNGVNAAAGQILLRNVHLRAPQTSDYVDPGSGVELLFVASNESPDKPDRLVSITSDVGTVTLSGDGTVPAGGILVVGSPDGQITPLENVEAADAVTAEVALTKPITNGLTYDFTFDFEKAGKTTVGVPISAGNEPRRDSSGESGNTGGGH